MGTAVATHELLPEGLHLESLRVEIGRVSISAASGARRSRCPLCGRGSSRVHSRYPRTVSDLPWHGISVGLEVRARRFFCERLPEIAARAEDRPLGGGFARDPRRAGRARRRQVGPHAVGSDTLEAFQSGCLVAPDLGGLAWIIH
jgi:transposase